MKVADVQFLPWDKTYIFEPKDIRLELGDFVVVKTELDTEVGKIVGLKEITQEDLDKKGIKEVKPIVRKANRQDIEKMKTRDKEKPEAIRYFKKSIKKLSLPMKPMDVHFSLDGGRITLAFIADGRVDFRDLVKDLTRHFQKSIRLHQLGIRDEARAAGDYGACGQKLCCKRFLSELGNVTSELVMAQQVSHRGSERLSGVCGRLKCCLAYEQDLYEDLAKKMPAIGSVIKTKHGKGEVIGWHTLKGTVDLKLEGENTVIEVEV